MASNRRPGRRLPDDPARLDIDAARCRLQFRCGDHLRRGVGRREGPHPGAAAARWHACISGRCGCSRACRCCSGSWISAQFLGLPGNPVSVLATWLTLGRCAGRRPAGQGGAAPALARAADGAGSTSAIRAANSCAAACCRRRRRAAGRRPIPPTARIGCRRGAVGCADRVAGRRRSGFGRGRRGRSAAVLARERRRRDNRAHDHPRTHSRRSTAAAMRAGARPDRRARRRTSARWAWPKARAASTAARARSRSARRICPIATRRCC